MVLWIDNKHPKKNIDVYGKELNNFFHCVKNYSVYILLFNLGTLTKKYFFCEKAYYKWFKWMDFKQNRNKLHQYG